MISEARSLVNRVAVIRQPVMDLSYKVSLIDAVLHFSRTHRLLSSLWLFLRSSSSKSINPLTQSAAHMPSFPASSSEKVVALD